MDSTFSFPRAFALLLCVLLAFSLPFGATAEDGYRGQIEFDMDGVIVTAGVSVVGNDLVAFLNSDDHGRNNGLATFWLEGGETLHIQYGARKASISVSELQALAQEGMGAQDPRVAAYLEAGLMTDALSLAALEPQLAQLLTDAAQFQEEANGGWSVTVDERSFAALAEHLGAYADDDAFLTVVSGLQAWDVFAPEVEAASRKELVAQALRALSEDCGNLGEVPFAGKLRYAPTENGAQLDLGLNCMDGDDGFTLSAMLRDGSQGGNLGVQAYSRHDGATGMTTSLNGSWKRDADGLATLTAKLAAFDSAQSIACNLDWARHFAPGVGGERELTLDFTQSQGRENNRAALHATVKQDGARAFERLDAELSVTEPRTGETTGSLTLTREDLALSLMSADDFFSANAWWRDDGYHAMVSVFNSGSGTIVEADGRIARRADGFDHDGTLTVSPTNGNPTTLQIDQHYTTLPNGYDHSLTLTEESLAESMTLRSERRTGAVEGYSTAVFADPRLVETPFWELLEDMDFYSFALEAIETPDSTLTPTETPIEPTAAPTPGGGSENGK